MTADDWVQVRPLLDIIVVQDGMSSSGSSCSLDSSLGSSSLMTESRHDLDVECDSDGFPVLFGAYLQKSGHAETHEAAIFDLVSAASTQMYPDTTLSDCVVEEPAPIVAQPRKRKADALSVRKAQATTKRMPRKAPAVTIDEGVLTHPRLACTANEKPRAEVTAFVVVDGCKRRVHVRTFWKHVFGSKYRVAAEKLVGHIATSKVTKSDVLGLASA